MSCEEDMKKLKQLFDEHKILDLDKTKKVKGENFTQYFIDYGTNLKRIDEIFERYK